MASSENELIKENPGNPDNFEEMEIQFKKDKVRVKSELYMIAKQSIKFARSG